MSGKAVWIPHFSRMVELAHWLDDADLAGIREPAALEKLPETDRESFESLWRDVKALLQELTGSTPTQPEKTE